MHLPPGTLSCTRYLCRPSTSIAILQSYYTTLVMWRSIKIYIEAYILWGTNSRVVELSWNTLIHRYINTRLGSWYIKVIPLLTWFYTTSRRGPWSYITGDQKENKKVFGSRDDALRGTKRDNRQWIIYRLFLVWLCIGAPPPETTEHRTTVSCSRVVTK